MCLQVLVKVGADVNEKVGSGSYGSALAATAVAGKKDCLRLVITAGADVNRPLESGLCGSALAAAAACGKLRCLWLLIKAGADVKQESCIGLLWQRHARGRMGGKCILSGGSSVGWRRCRPSGEGRF